MFCKRLNLINYSSVISELTFKEFNILDAGVLEKSVFTEFPTERSISLLDQNPNRLLCENFVYDYGSIFNIVYEGDFKERYTEVVHRFTGR